MRLLHTSDVHLAGTGHEAPGHHLHPCLCSLVALHRLAVEHRVDAVVIAGDLFDHARVGEELVTEVFGRLDRIPGEVVLLVGNHDVHDDRSIYRRYAGVVESSSVLFVDDHDGLDVRILDGAVHLWGRAMDEHSSSYRPLHGVADRPEDECWYLVVGHGHHIGDEPPERALRSSVITSDDIAATEADYVALGHHHVTTDVSAGGVTAWYSGAPTGWGGGQALVVDLDPDVGVTVTAVAVDLGPDGCA